MWLLESGRCSAYSAMEAGELQLTVSSYGSPPEIWIAGIPDSAALAAWLRDYDQPAHFFAKPHLEPLVRANLNVKLIEKGDFHRLPVGWKSPKIPPLPIRRLNSDDIFSLAKLPDEAMEFFMFWKEIDEMVADTVIYGHMSKGDVDAFAMIVAQTGRFADIGIWTAKEKRRQGISYACSLALIDSILRTDRTPTWGCDHSNLASKSLSLKLGFVKIGEMFYASTKVVTAEVD